MSDAYLIGPPEDLEETRRYSIGGTTPLTVGPVDCPDCSANAWMPYHYPGFDMSTLGEDITRLLERFTPGVPYRNALQGPGRLNPDKMRDLSARLGPVLGPDRPFGPGTGLGINQGKAEGLFSDFNWELEADCVYLRRSVHLALQQAGFALTAFAGGLTYRREREDPLVEIEVLPAVRIHTSQRPRLCETCGFATARPKHVNLEAASFDDSIPIHRVWENPRLIVVSPAFAKFIRERQFSVVRLTPLTLK